MERVSRNVAYLGAATAVVVLAGLPAYVVLDARGLLPLAVRDRPWPLELVALAGLVALLLSAKRLLREGRRAAPIGCAVVAVASLVAFEIVARRTWHELPPPPRELQLGSRLDFALPDETGREVRLSSRRGRPVLLYFYRGSL